MVLSHLINFIILNFIKPIIMKLVRYSCLVTLLFYTSLNMLAQDNRLKVEAIFSQWMLTNCGTADGYASLVAQIKASVLDIEPMWFQAFENGPGDELIRTFERGSSIRFKEMKTYLNSQDIILPPAEQDIYKKMTEAEYIKKEFDDYVFSYKTKALSGMGVSRSKRALDFLLALSKNNQSLFKPFALLAINNPVTN